MIGEETPIVGFTGGAEWSMSRLGLVSTTNTSPPVGSRGVVLMDQTTPASTMATTKQTKTKKKKYNPLMLFFSGVVLLVLVSIPHNLRHHSLSADSSGLEEILGHRPPVDSAVTTNTNTTSNSTAHAATTTTTTIRKWGCHRRETPLIFVHIGKAGGGLVRARFAAAAQNYQRGDQWHDPSQDQHFYPVRDDRNASFCSSNYKNWRVADSTPLWTGSFEGNMVCEATSPIGMAMACPEPVRAPNRCVGCQEWNDTECHTVYVGHNGIGVELHWLSPAYLEEWWSSTPWVHDFPVDWKSLDPNGNESWCQAGQNRYARPVRKGPYRKLQENCSVPIADYWDSQFNSFWKHNTTGVSHGPLRAPTQTMGLSSESTTTPPTKNMSEPVLHDYSPIYASLPIQRVTLVRDPWSWLLSKFFWHNQDMVRVGDGLLTKQRCDDLERASRTDHNHPGWAYRYALHYIGYLCGDDCIIRLEREMITLQELQMQTEGNLRNSFSIVGLLNETGIFFDMVSTRVAYVDMNLNQRVQGKRHQSIRTTESRRCKEVFADPAFQESFKKMSPVVELLDHLYHVAVEVNRFQLEELKQCDDPDGRLSKNNATSWSSPPIAIASTTL